MNTLPKFPESLLNNIDTVHAEATAIFKNIDPKALSLISFKSEEDKKPLKPKIK